MKRSFLLFAFLLNAVSHAQSQNENNKHFNVIIFLADDLGYGDLSCQENVLISTPNIDKLAAEGMRFTNFYAAGTVCAPSRRGLLTGRYAARIQADGNELPGKNMSSKEITLAELFKTHGYKSACIGKWHLGMAKGSHPNDQGFDYFYGTSSSNDHFPRKDFKHRKDGFKNETALKNSKNEDFNVPLYRQLDTLEIPAIQEFFTQRYTNEAVKWINANKDNPFFLYVAYNMPHVPVFPSDSFRGKSKKGIYGDVIEEIDWSVGEIMESLRNNKLDNNTLVIFTSDNGPWKIYAELGGSSGPFRNGKGTCWEGAFRVPGIFWWPGMIEPSVCDASVSQLDFFATFSALLDEPLPDDRIYDSKSILPLLKGIQETPRENFCYFAEKDHELWAIRNGQYKLHVKTTEKHGDKPTDHVPPLLFDLLTDPGETKDIRKDNPEIVQKMLEMIQNFNAQLKGYSREKN
jgi:arylsulfatase A